MPIAYVGSLNKFLLSCYLLYFLLVIKNGFLWVVNT